MKTVLVTGGAGYIGSVLVQKLLACGYRVRVYDRLIFGRTSLRGIEDKVDLIAGDIRHITPKMLTGTDAIIHLAGFSTDPTSEYDPRLTISVNYAATERLARFAKKIGIERFIYASSCSIYFSFNTDLKPPLYNEQADVNPISSYSITKRASELALLALVDKNFRPIIFRQGTLYGYSPRMRYDLVFNSFTRDAFSKQALTLDGGGRVWRPLIDIQDVVNSYIKGLELPLQSVGAKIFNVADTNWKISDLAEEIKNIIYRKKGMKITTHEGPPKIARNYSADNSLFKSVFSFTPSRTMESALLEIWKHLEEKGSDPYESIHNNDAWYKSYFESKQGKKFKNYE